MTDTVEYKFRIDAYSPDTLPMSRLAEYMTDLAVILGEQQRVHFVRLEKGSAVLVQEIEAIAVPKVRERVDSVGGGSGPNDAMTAYDRLNRRLKSDNCVAALFENEGAEIIQFPGRESVEQINYEHVEQVGSLDGKIIRLGGTQERVPVHIASPDQIHTHCFATREMAKTLGHYIFGPELRFHGNGKWNRDELGHWELDRFAIASFEVLDEQPLSAVVARLRDIPGSEWQDIDDPWAALESIRDVNEGET